MRSDPPTGDELSKLLVTMKTSVLVGIADSPQENPTVDGAVFSRGVRPRVVGIIVAVAILLGLGTAGGAVAFGLLPDPFEAPVVLPSTSTPTQVTTPTPTAPPTEEPVDPPQPVVAAPVPRVPHDCSALMPDLAFKGIVPNVTLGSPTMFEPRYAGLAQSGVLSCFWYSSDPARFSLLSLDIAADRAGGLAEVGTRLASGASALGVGDASSITCDEIASGCQVSLVIGDYWVEFAHEGTIDSADPAPLLAEFAQSLVEVLDGLPPGPAWTMPATSWAPVSDCSALSPSASVGDIAGNPDLVGPTETVKGAQNGIDFALSHTYTCWWSMPEGVTSPPDRPSYLGVQLTPGARWAFEAIAAEGGTPVTVAGADAAVEQCRTAEGTWCTLDVLTDDSWLQVMYSPDPGSDYPSPLIAVAEAILAAHG
jgi:hypothetical protein